MILSILGRRRVTVLLSLLASCVLLGGFYFVLLLPQVSASDRTLRTIRGDVSGMESQTQNLKRAYEEFQLNQSDYDRIVAVDFFNTQDRLQIRDRFIKMKQDSGVMNARYEFSPAQLERNAEIEAAGYRIMKSEIYLTIDAADDMSVYKFLYALVNEFPGRVNVVNFSVTRENKGLSTDMYKQILGGPMPSLLIATVKAEWRSIVSAEEIKGLMDDVAATPEDPFQ